MPSTLKDSVPSASEIPAAGAANGGNWNEDGARQQTVALEVPVTVNGARAVEGSDKREPFSEATKTVLVLGSGAVIRLSSAVTPGQLIFLTNDKTKKEVVCQVVKSKNYGSASGYVELEFTEPVQGFWGLRFPSERTPASPATPAAIRPATIPPSAQTTDLRPVLSSGLSKAGELPSAPGQADAKIPTGSAPDPLHEFTTEIKSDSRPMSKADLLAPAEISTQALKIETSRLQEQLSSLLFAESNTTNAPQASTTPASSMQNLGETAARIFEIASDEPLTQKAESTPRPAEPISAISTPKAPLSTATTFEAEEVKIPAWLEPLARNAAIPAPPEPPSSSSGFEELSAPEPKQPQQPKQSAPIAKTRAAAPAAPVFGRSLLGASAAHPAKTSSNKGILIAVSAGILVVAAGATWYLRQSSNLATNANPMNSVPASTSAAAPPPATTPTSPASSVAPVPSTAVETMDKPAPQTRSTLPVSSSDGHPVSSSGSAAKVQPAVISERVPKSIATVDSSAKPSSVVETAEPEIKKPTLGNVHLAKPKIDRATRATVGADAAPTLDDATGEQLSAGAPSMSGLLEGSAKQPASPAAPVPVGGDVTPARLISSAPPAYPTMAKAQHIAGDVRIDALIDASGHVSAMKVVSGPTLLHQAAMDALRQWKYQAASLDGKPVAMHLTVTIQFRLQ